MDDHLFGLVELVLVFGVVMGWAWWDLRGLKRDRQRTAEREQARQRQAAAQAAQAGSTAPIDPDSDSGIKPPPGAAS